MTEFHAARHADDQSVKRILAILRDVLAQLDAAQLPADIGAHVDLALCRLEEFEGVRRPANN